MGKLSMIGKIAKKAGKWALKHPDEVMSAAETGINIRNSIRERKNNDCDSSDLENKIQELQNNITELQNTIANQQIQIDDIKADYQMYKAKTKKTFIFIAIFTLIAIILISGISTFMFLNIWLLL